MPDDRLGVLEQLEAEAGWVDHHQPADRMGIERERKLGRESERLLVEPPLCIKVGDGESDVVKRRFHAARQYCIQIA